MEKIKAFLDATGAFFRWMWQYPTTPLENFQDAKFRYTAQIDPKTKAAYDALQKSINEHSNGKLKKQR